MSKIGQLPLDRRAHQFGGTLLRWMQSLKPGQASCMTLYAMHLASGVPVDMEPGICPVCGSPQCKLARALAHRGAETP
jgi:hypothetical protein